MEKSEESTWMLVAVPTNNVMSRAGELLGIVLFRFRPLVRVFAFFLMLVNVASLFFLGTLHGQVVFGAMIAGILIMMVIYSKLGFVRLLGLGHVFWYPMLFWIVKTLPSLRDQEKLHTWLVALLILNGISLVIDTLDVLRFALGERKPHYYWKKEERV